MRRRLSALLALGLCSCVHAYAMPRSDEPHAIVKLRMVYHVQEGPQRTQFASLNDLAVPVAMPSAMIDSSVTPLLVRLEHTHWVVGASYFHTEQRQVQETYYENETYSCSEYNYTTHRTEMRTCTRSVARTRTVTRTVTVTDGACNAEAVHTPGLNDIYLLQFSYFGSGHCELSCYRQIPGMNDTFSLLPCSQTQ